MWQENAFGDTLIGFLSFMVYCISSLIFWELPHQSWNDKNKRIREAFFDYKFRNLWCKTDNVTLDSYIIFLSLGQIRTRNAIGRERKESYVNWWDVSTKRSPSSVQARTFCDYFLVGARDWAYFRTSSSVHSNEWHTLLGLSSRQKGLLFLLVRITHWQQSPSCLFLFQKGWSPEILLSLQMIQSVWTASLSWPGMILSQNSKEGSSSIPSEEMAEMVFISQGPGRKNLIRLAG